MCKKMSEMVFYLCKKCNFVAFFEERIRYLNKINLMSDMKKRTLSLLLLAGMMMACVGCTQNVTTTGEDLVSYVEPRIGTAHCRYFHFAPGALPFGMAKPGPSTNGHLGNKDGWEATGYDYRDTSIEGFPCVHEFQVGGITLMPTQGCA